MQRKSEISPLRLLGERFPWATAAALLVFVVAFVIQSAVDAVPDPETSYGYVDPLTRLGANSVPLVEKGQFFRLIVPVIWHWSLPHLIVNLTLFGVLGSMVEWSMGRARWVIIALAAAIGSFGVSVFFGDFVSYDLLVGAEGVVGGFFGALVTFVFRFFRGLPRRARKCLLATVLGGAALTVVFGMIIQWPAGPVFILLALLFSIGSVGAFVGSLVTLILAGGRSWNDKPSHEAGTRTVRLAMLCGALTLSAAVWATAYASSDAYVTDANRSFVYHLERQREVHRPERMREFAQTRLSRKAASLAELQGALSIVEEAQKRDPHAIRNEELLDEIRARIEEQTPSE